MISYCIFYGVYFSLVFNCNLIIKKTCNNQSKASLLICFKWRLLLVSFLYLSIGSLAFIFVIDIIISLSLSLSLSLSPTNYLLSLPLYPSFYFVDLISYAFLFLLYILLLNCTSLPGFPNHAILTFFMQQEFFVFLFSCIPTTSFIYYSCYAFIYFSLPSTPLSRSLFMFIS